MIFFGKAIWREDAGADVEPRGASNEAPKEWGVGRHGSGYGEFWRILGGTFIVRLPVLHAKLYNLLHSHNVFVIFCFKWDLIQIKES